MDAITDHHGGVGPATETARADLSLGSPLRPPDWRWQRAGQLLVPGALKHCQDDAWVARARRFRASLVQLGDADHPRLARADPTVLAACRLSEGPGRIRWEVEARLLAGQADAEIAAKVGVSPDVVAAYETLFFEVRDGLNSPDWVALVAIGPRLHEGFGPGDLEILWKLFSYNGGPLVLDSLIAATGGGSTGSMGGEADRRLAELFGLTIAVMTTPSLPGPLDWARLNDLSADLHRRGAASGVLAISNPIVVTPPVVDLPGPAAGLTQDAVAVPDNLDDHDIARPIADQGRSLREAG